MLITTCTNELIQRDEEDSDSTTTTTTTTTMTTTSTTTDYDSTSQATPDNSSSSSGNGMDSSTSVDQDIYNETANPVNQDIYNSEKLFSHPPNETDISNVVGLRLFCEIDNNYCKKVQQSFIAAATKFSQVVNIKNKIVFQGSYYSFCLNRCSNNTYGWGTPSSQFTMILEQADSNFFYPQALAKQFRTTDNANWEKYDVAVDINHDMYMNALKNNSDSTKNISGVPPGGGYWFNVSNEPQIEDHQVDLEYVILHQMMHGLGMVSSWAPYFSDYNSPFQQLLKGIIPLDNLKVMTPTPYWYVKQYGGPTYVSGFQPNVIFDKFLHLKTPTNETVGLVEYGFDMQGYCIDSGGDRFIVNFMNKFLNNATQSSRAKSMYVAMATPKTLMFEFDSSYYVASNNVTIPSAYFVNDYLNQTYKTIQMMTGPEILSPSTTQEAYYRPGISTSHVDDLYIGTPDFLMTHKFVRGKTLQSMIDDGYSSIPTVIKYNTTVTVHVNVTIPIVHNGTHNATTNMTTITYNTTTETREQTMENVYKSAIGPGILRILETIGYSTVLTNTNYLSSVIKTDKPETRCDDNNSNKYNARSDDPTPLSSTNDGRVSVQCNNRMLYFIVVAFTMLVF